MTKCLLCGEPMPESEAMFNYHGFSGPCPKPVKPKDTAEQLADLIMDADAPKQLDDRRAENRRLKIAFLESSRMLTLEQLQDLSVESVRVLADLRLVGDAKDRE